MATDDKTVRLGTMPISRLFLRLAVPAVLGQLRVLLNNVIDRAWVGHIGGSGALALGAVGMSLPILHLFLAVILMLTVGMSTYVSILLGRGERALAARVSGSCFGLALAVNVVAAVGTLGFADQLLLAFGAGAESLPFARSYLTTLAWGMPFSHSLLMMTLWLNAQGYVSDSVKLNALSVVTNLVLDPVLIFPCGMGVTGAALATNLGGIVALACGLGLMARNAGFLRFRLADLVPRRELCMKPMALGLSTLLNVGLESIGLMFLNAGLQKYGGDRAVATVSLFGVPLLILMNLCLGLSHGAQPIISYNYGAGRIDRVREVNRRFVLVSFACSLVLWLVAMVAPRPLWQCFTSDAALIVYATGKTRLFFAVLLFGGIQYAHTYVIKFLGQVKVSLFLGVLKRLVLLLPLIFALPVLMPHDQATAVLLASPLSEAGAFAVTAICYFRVMRGLARKAGESV